MYEDNTRPDRVTAQRAHLRPPPCLPTPPPELADPVICYGCLDRPQWTRMIRGMIPDSTCMGLVLTLADYGDSKGRGCHPGVVRLTEDLCCSERTVRRHLTWLTEYGFLHLAKRAGYRRGGAANEYRLAIPAPVAAAHWIWSADDPWWVERRRGDTEYRVHRLPSRLTLVR